MNFTFITGFWKNEKKIKLFSNFTAHSGVITLEDGWGFSFQLEHFLFYNKYTVKVNKSIFKLCYEGCYEASRHRYPRRLGLNNLFLVFCRKISRILEMKTKGFYSFQNESQIVSIHTLILQIYNIILQ